jgi:hypothetical protein
MLPLMDLRIRDKNLLIIIKIVIANIVFIITSAPIIFALLIASFFRDVGLFMWAALIVLTVVGFLWDPLILAALDT